jgi:HD-GYP domain-containing protein (c-di-GMP phosphodiesterase class II)
MKTHPQMGYDILTKFNHMTPEAKIIVLEHHERHSGSGYPNGIRGEKIHIYSKVCTIADVFEALVAKRPYKKQKTFFDALKIMKEQMNQDFDPEFFRKFVLLFTDQRVRLKYA